MSRSTPPPSALMADYHGDDSDFDDYIEVAVYSYPDQYNRHLHLKTRCELKPGVTPYEG